MGALNSQLQVIKTSSTTKTGRHDIAEGGVKCKNRSIDQKV
jgi:hypothetical protein